MITRFLVNVPGSNDPAEFTLYYAHAEEYSFKGFVTVLDGMVEFYVADVGASGSGAEYEILHRAQFEAIKWVRAALDIQVAEPKPTRGEYDDLQRLAKLDGVP